MGRKKRSFNNWGETPGFHSRLTEEQKQELILAWVTMDWDYESGKKYLDARFNPPLSRSTVYGLRKELKDKWGNVTTDIDDPVDWRDFAAVARHSLWIGVKPATLRRMFDELQRARDDEDPDLSIWRGLFVTYRSLHWWSYVMGYYGEDIHDPVDRQLIGDQYAVREMASERAGGKFQKEALDAWLRYTPWASTENEADYLKKTQAKRIPELDMWPFFNAGWALRDRMKVYRDDSPDNIPRRHDELLGLVTCTALVAALMNMAPKPYLLPSQNVPHFEAEIARWETNAGAFGSFRGARHDTSTL